jgi:hypothetical protein
LARYLGKLCFTTHVVPEALTYFDMTDYWDFKKEQEQQGKGNANNVTQITKINL